MCKGPVTLIFCATLNLWEKLEALRFPSLNQVRNIHNYPKFFLNPMHNRKKKLYFKKIQKVLMKTIPQIRMFPNQIHMVNMKIEIIEVL